MHAQLAWRQCPCATITSGCGKAFPEGLDPPLLELRRAFLREHLEALGTARGGMALDVGCGEGQLTAELAGTGMSVIGIDVAEEPLRRARASRPELDLRLVPAEGPWPLDDASFDLVGRERRSSTSPTRRPGSRKCDGY